jgi:PDZ domain-containing protein
MNLPPPLPPPPPPPKHRWWRIAVVAVVFGVVLGSLGAYIDVPYYTLGPGPAKDVSELVHVSGERVYPSSGNFFLTTVAVSSREVSLFEAFIAWIARDQTLVKRDVVVQPGLTDEQQSQYNLLDMEQSKYEALLAALRATGFDTPAIRGARVIGVAAGFPADKKLLRGDLIVEVDGAAVRTPAETVERIVSKPIGSKLSVTVLRGDDRITTEMRSIASPIKLKEEKDRPVLGIRLANAVRLPGFDVTIDSQNIGGPSAGLAFALTIVDVLTTEDFTRGHHVAVTGTIDGEGHVGPVGGVEFKVVAAEREGADIFLVPADEFDQARGAASDKLRVIGVSTLEEALAQLRKLAQVVPRSRRR